MTSSFRLVTLVVGLAACGAPSAPISSPEPPAAAAPVASAAQSADSPAAPPDRDPAIAALVSAILTTCKVDDDGSEVMECPAVKAWDEGGEVFADHKADATLFSMLGDANMRVRKLSLRSHPISPAFWATKERALALAALAKAEKDDDMAGILGSILTDVDWEALGLGDTLKDVAQHAHQRTRRSIGVGVLERHVNATTSEVVRLLADDADHHVADPTVEELWRADSQAPVCELMTKLMAGGDYRQSTAILSGSRSNKCPGMADRVIVELTQRLAEPGKVDRENNRGWDYVRATRHLCLHHDEAAVKKKGLELLKRFMAPAIADPKTRVDAMRFYVECDPKGAPAALARQTSDKTVGKDAKEILEELRGKAPKR